MNNKKIYKWYTENDYCPCCKNGSKLHKQYKKCLNCIEKDKMYRQTKRDKTFERIIIVPDILLVNLTLQDVEDNLRRSGRIITNTLKLESKIKLILKRHKESFQITLNVVFATEPTIREKGLMKKLRISKTGYIKNLDVLKI